MAGRHAIGGCLSGIALLMPEEHWQKHKKECKHRAAEYATRQGAAVQ